MPGRGQGARAHRRDLEKPWGELHPPRRQLGEACGGVAVLVANRVVIYYFWREKNKNRMLTPPVVSA